MVKQQSYTLSEWCERRRVSHTQFYKLRKLGKAPRTHNNGVRQLVSYEADQDWVAEREREAEESWAAGLPENAGMTAAQK